MENNCLNCQNFTWWDNDYCCLAKFLILCESDEDWNFSDDILKTLCSADECIDWKMDEINTYLERYREKYNEFINKKKDE